MSKYYLLVFIGTIFTQLVVKKDHYNDYCDYTREDENVIQNCDHKKHTISTKSINTNLSYK